MISLQHLTDKKCPTCGAEMRNASMDGLHCNGEQFESITYRCGCKIRYVPNFSRQEIETECPQSPKSKDEKQHVAVLVSVIRSCVNESPVRDSVKNRILSALEYLS